VFFSFIDKIGREEAESAFKEKLWPIISAHPDLFPIDQQSEAGYLNVFHRMGSLIMAYAFHDTLPDKDEDEDMDSDDEGEEEEEKVNVSMVPMADMLNHKTGHNNVSV
jgi:SET domain-containing protein 6